MKNRNCLILAALAAVPCALLAQDKTATPASPVPANPITMSEKGFYGLVSGEVVAAAQKMPEANYSFKPTPDVRSFGQLVGHVADAQYSFCAAASGEPDPMKMIEKTVTAKADLIAALKGAVTYCNKVYAGMTDAQGGQMVKLMGYNMARLGVLSVNTAHTDEHYGNMVTYLRMNKIVPPSSESQDSGGKK